MSGTIIDGTAGGTIADQVGTNTIILGDAPATVLAGLGTDTILAGSGRVLIEATGNSNPISVTGGAGDIVFVGGPGNASIAGGARTTVLPSSGIITLTASGGPIDIYNPSLSADGYYEITPDAGGTVIITPTNGGADASVVFPGHTLIVQDGIATLDNNLTNVTVAPTVVDGVSSATGSGTSSAPYTISSGLVPTLEGTGTPKATVTITEDGITLGTALSQDDGRWQVTLAGPLQPGTHTLSVTEKHEYTNTAIPGSTDASVVLSVPVATPIVTNATDGAGNSIDPASPTIDRNPVLNGTTTSGTTVQVFLGSTLLGDATIASDGTDWTFAVTSELPVGTDTLTAVASEGGASSLASDPLTLRVVVAAPTVDTATDSDGTITGETAEHRPLLSGQTEAGTSVTVYDNGQILGTATVTGTTWSFAPTADLLAGAHDITATATDAASGESSAASLPLSLAVDPAPPVITGVTDPSGTYPSGFVTDDAATLTGTTEPGTAVSIYDGVQIIGEATVTGSTWTFTLDATLGLGSHTLIAVATDAPDTVHSGNSNSFDIAYIPAPPTISGLGALEGITTDTDPVITGTAAPGSTVTIFDGASTTPIATATALSDGTWQAQPADPLPFGRHSLTATAADAASGTTSQRSDALAVEVKPAAPVFTTGDGDTLLHQPTLSGTTEAGTTVTLTDNGASIGTATVTGDTWTFSPTTDLALGQHSIVAVAADPTSGETSDSSLPLSLTVDPAAPVITTITDGSGPHDSGIAISTSATLTGTADQGTVVTIYDGLTLLGQATSTGSVWSFAIDASIGLGDHRLTAEATDPSDGVASSFSSGFDITLLPQAPLIEGIAGSLSAVPGSRTTSGLLVISGTAAPGTTVIVQDGTVMLGMAVTGADGAWQVQSAQPLSAGVYTLTATAASGGLVSEASLRFAAHVVPAAPILSSLDGNAVGPSATEGVTADTDPQFGGTAAPDTTISVSDGGSVLGTTTADNAGNWSFTPSTPLSPGAHGLAIVSTDAAGDSSDPDVLALLVNPPPAPNPSAGAVGQSIRQSISTLLGPQASAAIVYGQEGQPSPTVGQGQIAGLSLDDKANGSTLRVPTGSQYISDIASGPVTVFGADGTNQAVVANGSGDLTYVAGSGPGILLADQSTARTILFIGTASSFVAATGSGNDVIVGGSGAQSLSGGTGANLFWLGSGQTMVDSAGVDTIVAGGGATTVTSGQDAASAAPHSTLLFTGSGQTTFDNVSGDATVSAGAGSDTLRADGGNAWFFGGKAGHNLLVGGTGNDTLTGGGDADTIQAGVGGGNTVLVAIGDNTLLDGTGSTGTGLYFAGSGHTIVKTGDSAGTVSGGSGQSTVFAGKGNDLIFDSGAGSTFVAGSGNATLVGGDGADLYTFAVGKGGGHMTIYNFQEGSDHIALSGTTQADVSKVLGAQADINGSAMLSLSDGTQITFVGLAQVKTSDIA